MPAPHGSVEAETLWQHAHPESTRLHRFLQKVNQTHGKSFSTYHELYQWSITDISASWAEIWQCVGVRASQPFERVVSDETTMYPRPAWFPGAKLNFAENLLFPLPDVDEDSVAVIAATETTREQVSWRELREKVRRCQNGMRAVGLKAGDRVAGYVANHTNALVASLAAISLGSIWTAVSPDTGVSAVLDRMVQIEPTLLVTDNAVMYNGKTHPVLPKVKDIVEGLPTLKAVVVFDTLSSMPSEVEALAAEQKEKVHTYERFVHPRTSDSPTLHFEQLDPDTPVYILYSSGTTGAPKCIVHGAIGTLLQHKKEHMLHSDIRAGDKFFYFTTCTWMMWHWLVSGLAAGATLVLYDGSPFRYRSDGGESTADDFAMPKLIDELGITQFGTSAKYLSVLEQRNVFPQHHGVRLHTLKAIYSTGSPLAPSTFQYVYQAFGAIHLASITGGTDIISLFGAPCPLRPVYTGEIQALGLGMACQAWDHRGTDISTTGEPGDLVCVRPFPCQPVTFWGPDGEQTYRASYFDEFPGVWHHGDFIRFNPATGGLVMLGRSDGVLKPSGVRFGSAELYNVILKHFPDEVEDALAIGRRRAHDDDETVVLFLKLTPPGILREDVVRRLKATIRHELSPRHVPGIVDQCPDIPVTANGKKVEKSVKQILCGLNITTSTSVANPDSLQFYRDWAQRH